MVVARMWKRGIPTLAGSRLFVPATALELRARWVTWRNRSTNRKILATSVLLVALTLVCKAAAAMREAVTAYWFGAGDDLDAMLVALALPTFAMMALGRSTGNALLPTLAQVGEQGDARAAERLVRESTFWFLLLLLVVTALLALCSGTLVRLACPGFTLSKQLLVRELLLLLVPIILLSGITSLWTSVLNSRQRFTASGLVPIFTPVSVIVAIWALGDVFGIRSLAIGVLMGAFAEMVTIGWLLYRTGTRLYPIAARPSPCMYRVLRQYTPLVFAAALMGSTTLIDNAMASQLGTGGVATLGYGRKLVALAVSLPAMSLSRAVFPHFAQQVANRQWSAVRDTLSKSCRATLMAALPLTIGLLVFAYPLITLVLQRGAFGAEETRLVSWVQAMYALQIPFYTIGILHIRLISSMRLNHLLTVSTLMSLVLNVVLNYLLMQVMGVAGIALSTSIVYAVACLFMAWLTHRAVRSAEAEVTA